MKSLLTLALALTPLWVGAQGTTSNQTPIYVSDRFADAVVHGERLVLSNLNGFVTKPLDSLETSHLEVIPGNATNLALIQDVLLVTSEGEGLFLYLLPANAAPPRQIGFVPIRDVSSVAVRDDRVWAAAGSRLHDMRLTETNELEPLQVLTLPQAIRDLELGAERGYVLLADGKLHVFEDDPSGLKPRELSIDLQGEVFYGIEVAGDQLIVDALDGVRRIRFDDDGNQSSDIYRNLGTEIARGMRVTQHEGRYLLFIRTVSQLLAFAREGDAWFELGATSFAFRDIAVMSAQGADLFLLNRGPRARNWSLARYRLENDDFSEPTLEPARFEDLAGMAELGGFVYLAAGNAVYRTPEAEVASFSPNSSSLWRSYNGQVSDLIATSDSLYVFTTLQNDLGSRLQIFELNDPTQAPSLAHTADYVGDLDSPRAANGRGLSFVQHFRDSQGEHFVAHVLLHDEVEIRVDSFQRDLPSGAANPFRDLQISEHGLLYHDESRIFVHPDPLELSRQTNWFLEGDEALTKLEYAEDALWLEFEQGGIALAEPSNEQVRLISRFPNWRALRRLGGGALAARNAREEFLGRYYMLRREGLDLIRAVAPLPTSAPPLAIHFTDEGLLIAEPSALTISEVAAPLADRVYLLPFSANAELEVNSAIGETDFVEMDILDDRHQVIGLERLSPDLIRSLNGRPLSEWIFDFDAFREPASLRLRSSTRLAPVLSGQANNNIADRFAHRVNPYGASRVFIPHIPSAPGWETNIVFRNESELPTTEIEISESRGPLTSFRAPAGATNAFNIDTLIEEEDVRWAALRAMDLQTVLSGYSVLEHKEQELALSIPLEGEPSIFLAVPSILSRDDWWTGISLANPNDEAINLRLVAYDENGELTHGLVQVLQPRDNFVAVLNDLLDLNDPDTDQARPAWMVLIANEPITGSVIYGRDQRPFLGGLPIRADLGFHLIYTGIRARDEWRTTVNITNTASAENEVVIRAIDGRGALVTEPKTLILPPRGILQQPISELFPDLSTARRGAIQTLLVEAERGELTGFIFRQTEAENNLEAIQALAY